LEISKPEIFYDVRENDSLNTFMKKMNNIEFENKGYFFYIHHMLPHDPYLYNSDCTLKTKKIITYDEMTFFRKPKLRKTANFEGYKANYICMLKRVYEFVNFINKKDRNANVILISDHGQNIEDFFYLRFNTFTLVKINEACQQNISDKLNTAKGARLVPA
jgi:hypothetical protein